jgi:hypothetical protein
MSHLSTADASAAKTTSQSPPNSSTNTQTCSEGDRALFWASKYRNYTLFIQSISDYLPAAQPWATSLRICPLTVFKLNVETYFGDAIEAHRRGDNTARDIAASTVVREQAHAHGLQLSKLRAPDLAKLLRYSSMFALLVAEEQ